MSVGETPRPVAHLLYESNDEHSIVDRRERDHMLVYRGFRL
jgi:hypothetical protein